MDSRESFAGPGMVKLKLMRIVLTMTLVFAMGAGCGNKSEVLQRYSLIADGQRSAFVLTLETYPVAYDSTAMGVFVKSVNGIPSTKTAYWLYFINGKPVPKAANEYVPAAGDTIEWRLISGY